ncbi:MAG: GtrA family protein [Candidatus Peribacteraceae bacterium]|jgi:putative flippase GtrA
MPRLRVPVIQFTQFLLSGGAAAVLAIAVYALLLQAGLWYVYASVCSDGVGLLTQFFLNKYLVFRKRERMIPHAVRYAVVQAGNTIFQAALVYVFVEFAGVDKILARILSIGVFVPVNFLLYKFFVYV